MKRRVHVSNIPLRLIVGHCDTYCSLIMNTEDSNCPLLARRPSVFAVATVDDVSTAPYTTLYGISLLSILWHSE